MSNKSIGGICAIISMVAVVIFLFWGFLGNAWDKSWLVFVVSGVSCAAVSIINRIRQEEKGKGDNNENS